MENITIMIEIHENTLTQKPFKIIQISNIDFVFYLSKSQNSTSIPQDIYPFLEQLFSLLKPFST